MGSCGHIATTLLGSGNYRRWILEDDGAKASFQKCLFEACEFAGWTLHAYCVMGNHYHLAVETSEPNLSEDMRWLPIRQAQGPEQR